MKRCFISAGETSGDMHAAAVVAELLARYPDAEISGVAGEVMQQNGCRALHHMHELNVMGITDVVRSLGRIRRVEASVLKWCATQRPDVAILVDFSSFHMRLGRKIRRMGIPVIHFIAPKLWAWGSWRVRKLKHSQDRLACILPFEPAWFFERGIDSASYVGNPSTVGCQRGWSKVELRKQLRIDSDNPLLAVLPGSRPQELRNHLPVLADSLQRLKQEIPDLRCVVPVAPGVDRAVLEPLWQLGAIAIDRNQDGYALRADVAIAVSGTATLELALWDTPTVLIYRASPLMVMLAHMLVQVRCAGLANIILGDQPVMPELIQDQCTVTNIVTKTVQLLNNEEVSGEQRAQFKALRKLLGDGNPASGVVDMVASLEAVNAHQQRAEM